MCIFEISVSFVDCYFPIVGNFNTFQYYKSSLEKSQLNLTFCGKLSCNLYYTYYLMEDLYVTVMFMLYQQTDQHL